ncbi:hypothetical protein CSKR_113542 [Clonorchis sinensis]|uniref:Uncharacterized protein n=1 Tax=Clonorchis sinensis TaxID=79923 RepID=A0A3R7FSB2_CLOSI|nr:hypothetical protein CSKR_113542 [Clonorchis sinensis]
MKNPPENQISQKSSNTLPRLSDASTSVPEFQHRVNPQTSFHKLDWAMGCGRDSEENSCGSAITLGMTVPCHHCTDMLRFINSSVAVVKGAAIGEGIRSSVAAGSGGDGY